MWVFAHHSHKKLKRYQCFEEHARSPASSSAGGPGEIDNVLSLFFDRKMAGWDDDLPFRIEVWDDADLRVEEVIATAADFFAASCAYEEAVKRRPGKLITLRQKARIIRKSR
jgi:hypothetical protein